MGKEKEEEPSRGEAGGCGGGKGDEERDGDCERGSHSSSLHVD